VFGFHRSSTEVLPSSNVQRKETIEDFHRCSTEVLPSPSNVQRKETIEAYTHVWAPAESPLQLQLAERRRFAEIQVSKVPSAVGQPANGLASRLNPN
jgi:hypothetical protein